MTRKATDLGHLTRRLEQIFATRVHVKVGVRSDGVYTIFQEGRQGQQSKEVRGRLVYGTRPVEVLNAIRAILPSGYTPLEVETADDGRIYQSFVPPTPD
ncbi:hypothetical protein HYY70_03940 [Candidatus Woesearchaeota archaeon]|nr:hypothetical protein [Candidatus Woesearchaeota archaeon]